ncbi:hypothetical protein [Streptomyces sp. E-08]|uniref:hypothetical protein n=1 Tax=Streptomyces sp. E-08 TaxID=3404047 RepID=UPI003CEC9461
MLAGRLLGDPVELGAHGLGERLRGGERADHHHEVVDLPLVVEVEEVAAPDPPAYAAEPPGKPTAIPDELMVKVQCADVADTDAVKAAIVERMEWAEAKLARYERLRERLLAGRNENEYFAEAERIGPYLTLLRGVSFEKENIRWSERALHVLERRATAPHDR